MPEWGAVPVPVSFWEQFPVWWWCRGEAFGLFSLSAHPVAERGSVSPRAESLLLGLLHLGQIKRGAVLSQGPRRGSGAGS